MYLNCKADIICLQETHWDDVCVREVKREWMGDVFVNNGTEKSRGVCILVRKGVIEDVTMCENDAEGRVLGVEFKCSDQKYRLLNIYAPNEEKERRNFFVKLGGVCKGECVIVGDFNVWCDKLDVCKDAAFRSDSSRAALHQIMRANGLNDVWRERNPDISEFTRVQEVRENLKKSRIDLILSTRKTANKIGEIVFSPTSISDHKIVYFQLGNVSIKKGGGVWCLNAALLKNEEYREIVRKCIKNRMNERMYDENVELWWERLKRGIKELSINFSQKMSRRERKRVKRGFEERRGKSRWEGIRDVSET